MTQFERSVQFWSVLVQAARTHHVVSYEQVERMTGIPRFGESAILANILYYCQQQGLPPLTSIVIDQANGTPASDDFNGLDLAALHRRVFVFDWLLHGAPTDTDFQTANANATAATV